MKNIECVVHIFDLSNTLGIADESQKEYGIDRILWDGAFRRFVELRNKKDKNIMTIQEKEELTALLPKVTAAYDQGINTGLIPMTLESTAREGLEVAHKQGIRTVIYSIGSAEMIKRIVAESLKVPDLIHGYIGPETLRSSEEGDTVKRPENFYEIRELLKQGKIIQGISGTPNLFVDDRELHVANASVAGIKGYHYNPKSQSFTEKISESSNKTKENIIVVPTIRDVYRLEKIVL